MLGIQSFSLILYPEFQIWVPGFFTIRSIIMVELKLDVNLVVAPYGLLPEILEIAGERMVQVLNLLL